MTDEFALRKAVDLAAKAERAISDPAIEAAFTQVETDYLAAWRMTEGRDTDGRERAWMAITLLGNVRASLQKAIDDGKVAQAELDQI